MSKTRKSYPSDASDAEWEYLAPYLTLKREDAPQREHALRDIFDAMRYVVKTGCQWDFLPHDFPPSSAVYQQARRWIAARVFEEITHDLRMILRLVDGREAQPTAAILDARTLQSTPESGSRAGFDGAKKKKGSKVHMAVDTLGHLLALMVDARHGRPPVRQDDVQRPRATSTRVLILVLATWSSLDASKRMTADTATPKYSVNGCQRFLRIQNL